MAASVTTENIEPISELPINSGNEIDEFRSHLSRREAFDALPAGGVGGNGRALTARQAAVLGLITEHHAVKGYPPTLREIAKALGIRSTNGVNDHLRALERKGYIVRGDTVARGIRIVDSPSDATAPDPVAFVSAENDALRSLLRRVAAAGMRSPSLTAEMVVILGDVRDALSAGGGH